jgi:hypothetical protein
VTNRYKKSLVKSWPVKRISLLHTYGNLIWQHSEERLTYRVGTMIDGYRTNLHQEKLIQGVEFLKLVNGRMYESLPARVIALENLADQLEEAHEGWDNYHKEPSIMRAILSYGRSSVSVTRSPSG